MTGLAGRLVASTLAWFLYGLTMAMMVESTPGLDPWDVFHEGVTQHVPSTFGQVVIATGALVLLLGSRSGRCRASGRCSTSS